MQEHNSLLLTFYTIQVLQFSLFRRFYFQFPCERMRQTRHKKMSKGRKTETAASCDGVFGKGYSLVESNETYDRHCMSSGQVSNLFSLGFNHYHIF